MVFRPIFVGRRTAALLLVIASIALHALVFGRLTGWFGGSATTSTARPVEVALLPPLRTAPPLPPVAAVPPPAPPPRAVVSRAASPRVAPPAPRSAAPVLPTASSLPPDPAASPVPPPGTVAGWETPETLPTAEAAKTDELAGIDPSAPAGTPADAPPPSQGESDIAALPAEREPVAAAAPVVPGLPASHSRRFRVYWGDFTEQRSVARLAYRLTREDDRYEIRTEGEAEGLIALFYSGMLIQVSRGRLGPQGLQPLSYAEQRGKRPERGVVFDQEGHRLLPAGGAAPVPLPPGTQDRLSVIYQIGLLARGDPASFVAGATRDMPVATLRAVQIQRFTVVGEETLMAPGGPIRSLHLHRPPVEGSDDPSIDLWLGYDFDMLPVRLRVEDAGRRVLDQLIERDG